MASVGLFTNNASTSVTCKLRCFAAQTEIQLKKYKNEF